MQWSAPPPAGGSTSSEHSTVIVPLWPTFIVQKLVSLHHIITSHKSHFNKSAVYNHHKPHEIRELSPFYAKNNTIFTTFNTPYSLHYHM